MTTGFFSQMDNRLHDARRRAFDEGTWLTSGTSASPAQLAASVVVFGLFYGAAMGTFSGVEGGRWLQVLFSSVKVPLLLLVTFGLALPSFFVLNTLVGVRDDWPLVLRALLVTQAVLTLVLASFAPFTLVWYASSANYQAAIYFNALMFALASGVAQAALREGYRPLLRRDARHRVLLPAWLLLYGFVGIQMAWVLRPFVGEPNSPMQFFRPNGWGNAYVELAQMVWKTLQSL